MKFLNHLTTIFLVLSPYLGTCQFKSSERVKIFDVDFYAKEVTGQNKFLADNTKAKNRSQISNILITQPFDDFLYSLGSFRENKGSMANRDLFNLSLQESYYPFLDSIDFDYYKSYGFTIVERRNPEMIKDSTYLKLKSTILYTNNLTISDKKVLLLKSSPNIRNQIMHSRYQVIDNPFTISKTKISKFTANIKSDIDTITINNNQLKAEIKLYLNRLVDQYINITGHYIDARLHPAYLDKINYYISSTPLYKIPYSQFSSNLKEAINSATSVANTGLVALQLSGSYNLSKVNIDTLTLDLHNTFLISIQDAKRIAMSVNFLFSRYKEITLNNNFNNVFIIRYFMSDFFKRMKFKPTSESDLFKYSIMQVDGLYFNKSINNGNSTKIDIQIKSLNENKQVVETFQKMSLENIRVVDPNYFHPIFKNEEMIINNKDFKYLRFEMCYCPEPFNESNKQCSIIDKLMSDLSPGTSIPFFDYGKFNITFRGSE